MYDFRLPAGEDPPREPPEVPRGFMKSKQLRGTHLIRRGVQYGREGDLERGILCLLEGLSLVDEREIPRLALSGYHNLALFLTHLRLTVLARAVIVRARPLYRLVGDPVMSARLVWLQGTLAGLSGNHRLAVQKLQNAVKLFEGLRQGEDLAKVHAELAEAELKLRTAPGDEVGDGEVGDDQATGDEASVVASVP